MKNFLIQRNRIIIPLGIILTGFFLRLYSLQHSYAINSDGMLYVQQAKAFHYGMYDSLTACYPYLNSLFIFISISYRIFGDWLVAAKVVSLFFSTITMVPLYLLLRRFLDFSVATCTLLVFAVNPILIEMSSRVIRDPSFWFFLTTGIYVFTLQDSKKTYWIFPLSCLSFLLAGLARFEAVVFIPASLLFLLVTRQDKKWQKIGCFCAPLLLIALLALLSLPWTGYDLKQWVYPRSLFKPFELLVDRYKQIRVGLTNIGAKQLAPFWSHYFFPTTSNLLWWIGLGAVLVEIIRTFFEPFFLLFAFGLKGIMERMKADRMLVYLLLLAAGAFTVLYLHELGRWTMRGRFVVFIMIPSFVVIGFGIENFLSLCGNIKQSFRKYFFLLLGVTIFVVPLPKNLDENRQHVKIFQDIGNAIALHEDADQEVGVAAAFDKGDLHLIGFFANLPVRSASCAHSLVRNIKPRLLFAGNRPWQEKISYLVWDEKNWSIDDLVRLQQGGEIPCTKISEWEDPKLGRLVLFKIDR